MIASSRNEIPVNVEKISENIYNAFYTPVSPGAYLLNIIWGHRYISKLMFMNHKL